jgi:membrane protein DedA with SNARE-associated domain
LGRGGSAVTLLISFVAAWSSAPAVIPGSPWAYVTLAISALVAEEVAAVAGGMAAAQGQLDLGFTMLACAFGTWFQAVSLYALGRWRGRTVRKRFMRLRPHLLRALKTVRRNPWLSIFAVRFAFGMRIAMPLACGAAHLRLPAYLLGTASASLLWGAVFALIGWLFGESALLLLGRAARVETRLTIAAALLLGIIIVITIIRRRRAARAVPRA